jgi:hypothetical protein
MSQNNFGKVIAKAWTDEAFKNKLLKDPVAACKEMGVNLPSGVTFQFHENSDKVVHVVIPKKPSGNLSEQELAKIAGGDCALGASVFTQAGELY